MSQEQKVYEIIFIDSTGKSFWVDTVSKIGLKKYEPLIQNVDSYKIIERGTKNE